MATVKFPSEMPSASIIAGGDKLMISKEGDGEAYQATFNQAKEYLNITGIELGPIVGGADSASATVVPAGPTGENRKAEASPGWYDFGSGPVEATADKRWTAYWDGTTWSLVDMGALPKNGEDDFEKYLESVTNTDGSDNLYNKSNNVDDKYVHISSGISISNGTMMNVFPVVPSKTYSVYSEEYPPGGFVLAFRATSDSTVGTMLSYATMINTSDPKIKRFVVPPGAYFGFVNLKLPLMNFDVSNSLIIQEGESISEKQIVGLLGGSIYDQGAVRRSRLTSIVPLYDQSNNVDNKYVHASNIIVTAAGTMLNVFPVIGGQGYTLYTDDYNTSALLIGFRPNNSVEDGSITRVPLQNTSDPNIKRFTAPEGSKYGFINVKMPSLSFDITATLKLNQGDNIIDAPIVTRIEESEIADLKARFPSSLKGKKWAVIGDSITARNFRSRLNYHDYLAKMVGGMTVYNYGISSTGYFDRFNVADTITQSPNDVDLISVFMGTNDWGNTGPNNRKLLGIFLDTYYRC